MTALYVALLIFFGPLVVREVIGPAVLQITADWKVMAGFTTLSLGVLALCIWAGVLP